MNSKCSLSFTYSKLLKDAIHTHFATLIGKWTIVGGWVKHRADNRGKVATLKYKSFVTSLERPDKKTGWVGKKLIVHLPIRVTKCVWMASLYHHFFTRLCKAHRISLSFRLIIEIKTIYSYVISWC